MTKTILVADDDPEIRKLLSVMFEHENGYELCEQAKNGKEAVEFATRCKPDLIILDFSMPLMSGIEAAKLIKTEMPSAPINLFTIHDKQIFSPMNSIVRLIDGVIEKSEMKNLLRHVHDLIRHRMNGFGAPPKLPFPQFGNTWEQ